MKDYEKIEIVFKICNRSWSTRYRSLRYNNSYNTKIVRQTSLILRYCIGMCGEGIAEAFGVTLTKINSAKMLTLNHEELLMENTIFNKIFGS